MNQDIKRKVVEKHHETLIASDKIKIRGNFI